MEDNCFNNEVSNTGDNDETNLFNNISKQLSFLNDKFKVYESFKEDNSDVIKSYRRHVRNNSCNINDINYSDNKKLEDEIQSLQNKIKEKNDIIDKIQTEYSDAEKLYNKVLKEKELIIDNLRRELDLMKCERNESINQMHNIFKEIGVDAGKNKFAIFNLRKGGNHSHQNSVTSISSLSTYHTDDKIIEKLNNEKLFLEKQLVEYKYKFAETSAKLNELEGEFDKTRKRCKEYADKIKVKDNLIKKISEERDHYKFNTNPHYSFNSCDYKPPEVNLNKIDNFHKQKTSDDEVNIVDDYYLKIMNTDSNSNKNKSIDESKKMTDKNNNSLESGSLIKYIKNIFKSGK